MLLGEKQFNAALEQQVLADAYSGTPGSTVGPCLLWPKPELGAAVVDLLAWQDVPGRLLVKGHDLPVQFLVSWSDTGILGREPHVMGDSVLRKLDWQRLMICMGEGVYDLVVVDQSGAIPLGFSKPGFTDTGAHNVARRSPLSVASNLVRAGCIGQISSDRPFLSSETYL